MSGRPKDKNKIENNHVQQVFRHWTSSIDRRTMSEVSDITGNEQSDVYDSPIYDRLEFSDHIISKKETDGVFKKLEETRVDSLGIQESQIP